MRNMRKFDKCLIGQATDTRQNWVNENPIIPNNILILESDTGRTKIGKNNNYNDTVYIPTDMVQFTSDINFYVDASTGDDSNSGLTEDSQLKTITEVFSRISRLCSLTNNITIYLKAGTYRANNTNCLNRLFSTLTITKNPKETNEVIITGTVHDHDFYELIIENVNNLVIINITITAKNICFRNISNITIHEFVVNGSFSIINCYATIGAAVINNTNNYSCLRIAHSYVNLGETMKNCKITFNNLDESYFHLCLMIEQNSLVNIDIGTIFSGTNNQYKARIIGHSAVLTYGKGIASIPGVNNDPMFENFDDSRIY